MLKGELPKKLVIVLPTLTPIKLDCVIHPSDPVDRVPLQRDTYIQIERARERERDREIEELAK